MHGTRQRAHTPRARGAKRKCAPSRRLRPGLQKSCRTSAGAAEEAGSGPGGEALALLELGEAGEFGGAGGAAAEAEADRQRALEAGTAAKLLRAEGDFAAAKADWEVRRRPNPNRAAAAGARGAGVHWIGSCARIAQRAATL